MLFFLKSKQDMAIQNGEGDNYCTRLYHFESILSLLKNEKQQQKHWLHYFMHVFEYCIFITFNPNYSRCFHTTLEGGSCKDSKDSQCEYKF
jgi:hypothetical protein